MFPAFTLKTALGSSGAYLWDTLQVTSRLPVLHLNYFSTLLCFSFSFFSGDHLFYLNSDPVMFSPVGSCLKKKSKKKLYIMYISTRSPYSLPLNLLWTVVIIQKAKQTKLYPFCSSEHKVLPEGYLRPWAPLLFWVQMLSYSCMESEAGEPLHTLEEGSNQPAFLMPQRNKWNQNFAVLSYSFSWYLY